MHYYLLLACALCAAVVCVKGEDSPIRVNDSNSTCTVTGGILEGTWCVMGDLTPCKMSYKFSYKSRESGQLMVLPGKPTHLSDTVVCFEVYHPVPTDLGVVDLQVNPCNCVVSCSPVTTVTWSSLFNGDLQRLFYEGRHRCIVCVVCANTVVIFGLVVLISWRLCRRNEYSQAGYRSLTEKTR
ncbi:membrane glycoprotein US6B [Cercopithecine betaherpesvirus 5]|uniref:Membrane glycoprotein US6B n=1 Tax=Simian cytomegalovirus (strain Colburn) TaxID=50292 RepID=G8XTL4_SCMVC|nr:membrane glycoprotein US6B [Cercopithecine betaherpesvirus 5]AEV80506.1 membrane glycoprotein US6B [Cercopithecine betaherpesvirus 5]